MEAELPLVRQGLEVDWVEANQGVGVTVGRAGGGVEAAERGTYLVPQRPTVFRAAWKQPPSGWTPRRVEGRLILVAPDGDQRSWRSWAWIDGPASPGDPDRQFSWYVPAIEIVPGLQYRVELHETEDSAEALPADAEEGLVPPVLPVDGSTALVGVESRPAVLKIVLVPINYDDGEGCATTTNFSDALLGYLHDRIYAMSPVQEVQMTVRAPVSYSQKVTDLFELLDVMVELRAGDGAASDLHYVGLIDVCEAAIGSGFSYIPPEPLPEYEFLRVSVVKWAPSRIEWTAETFVHELGHAQGRNHVLCSGTEDNVDLDYPHPHGQVDAWGVDLFTRALISPASSRDVMTYCHPYWMSSYGWTKSYRTLRELSSWDQAGDAADNAGTLLIASVRPGRGDRWFTIPGRLPKAGRRAGHAVEFWSGDTLVRSEPADHFAAADGDGAYVVVPLPAEFDAVTAIARVDDGDRRSVDVSAVRRTGAPFDRRGLP